MLSRTIIFVCVLISCLAGLQKQVLAQCSPLPNQIANGTLADATKVMGNFNALLGCLNGGQLTVPPVGTLTVVGPLGGSTAIQQPLATAPYTLGLPPSIGSAGQVLMSGGTAGPTYWATVPSLSLPPLTDGLPISRPALSSLTWLNQGAASAVEYVNGPITMTVPVQSGNELRGIGMPVPTTVPYAFTAKIDTLMWGSEYYAAGIYVNDNNGKVLSISYQTGAQGSALHSIAVSHFNSPTSLSATPLQKQISDSRVWWLRIANDGTYWNLSISHDGADWIPFYSENVTSFLSSSPSSFGVFGNNTNISASSPSSFISIWSFEVITGTGTNSSWTTR